MNLIVSFEKIDPVALYAATLSTLIAIWEVKKWYSRVRIQVTCSANMKIIQSADKRTYISINATNRGQTPTTITHAIMKCWPSKWNKIRNKNCQSYIINCENIPQKINPGETWAGLAIQDDEIEKMASNAILYCGIVHSMNDKETLKRVIIANHKK